MRMTVEEAIKANIKIEPGRKVETFGGWCRRDRVLLGGREIGRIQTRRARGCTELLTSAGNSHLPGYRIEWLVERKAIEPRGASGQEMLN